MAAGSYETWAQSVFGSDSSTHGGPQQDADGDGQANVVEWLAKTNPRSAADKFEISVVTHDVSGFKLRWLARAGVHYRVTHSADLITWSELPNSRRTGAGVEVEIVDPAIGANGIFYRVETVVAEP